VVRAGSGRGTDVLWAASLRPSTLRERVAAAVAGGFGGVSVSPGDAGDPGSGRTGRDAPEEVARWAAGQGVALVVVDSVIEWYPHEPPRRMLAATEYSVTQMLEVCDRFGVDSLGALAPFPSVAPVEELAGCFARLCDQAAEHGLRVQLEFTPFPPVPDLATAWQIVQQAGRRNGGILLDSWHFFRGRPDLGLLSSIPGDRIMGVQLSDGRAEFRESLLKDTFRHRELPGEGCFDLVGLLNVLHRTGGLNQVGPEVLSEELQALEPPEAAVRLAAATEKTMAAALGT
jgi:sugar phosphate isomerase/epimerase